MTPPVMSTALGALTIEPAKPDELELVMEIVNEAAAWLHARGITGQWPSPMPERESFKIFVDIVLQRVFLARLPDGSAVGTFRLEWNDVDLWGDDAANGGYLHTFAIRTSAHGCGVGTAIIAWAKEHVRARGRKFLRLDCWAENQALRDYYARLGFQFHGVIRADDGDADALWEMSA